MAHVQKRGPNRWRARYRDADGREHSQTFTRKADAENWLTTVSAARLRGEWCDPRLGRTTFKEWTERVEEMRVDRRPTTAARDAALMKTRVMPTFENRQLGRISTTDVRLWIAGLNRADLAPTTVRKCYQLLARVLAEAVESGLIAHSPCRNVQLPTDERHEPVLVTPEQVHALADAVPARYRALVLTAAYTGLRWGELAGLRVERLDFLRRRIEVTEILIEVDGKLSVGPPKTRKSRGSISFPNALAPVLSEHIKRYVEPGGLVFTSRDGTPLRRSNFRRRVWLPAAKAAKLPEGASFHSLRHACASWLIHAGANPLDVAEKLRHSRVGTTMGTYAHLFPGTDQRTDELLEAAFVKATQREDGSTTSLPAAIGAPLNRGSSIAPAASPRPRRHRTRQRREGNAP